MKIVAFGDNIICEQIDKKDETIMGKVISCATRKLKVGDIVFYNDRNYDNLNVGNKTLHAVWANFIRAKGINEKEVKEIEDDLPDLSYDKHKDKSSNYKGGK